MGRIEKESWKGPRVYPTERRCVGNTGMQHRCAAVPIAILAFSFSSSLHFLGEKHRHIRKPLIFQLSAPNLSHTSLLSSRRKDQQSCARAPVRVSVDLGWSRESESPAPGFGSGARTWCRIQMRRMM